MSPASIKSNLNSREIRSPNYGKCFEIDLSKLNQTIESVSLETLLPIYVYVNIPGQFHNGDSYSKIEVTLRQCLFIELSYEILIQNDHSSCRRWHMCCFIPWFLGTTPSSPTTNVLRQQP